jgi:hypothetical protein
MFNRNEFAFVALISSNSALREWEKSFDINPFVVSSPHFKNKRLEARLWTSPTLIDLEKEKF